MDVRLSQLAAGQADLVAAWQLLAMGWTESMIEHRLRHHGWRRVHRGVYALTQAPLTRRQLWVAATLTAPGSALSHASAGACHGFRQFEGSFETITRPGGGGRRRRGGLLVFRSKTLDGEVTRREGIPITTAERTLADLAPHLDPRETARTFREALRLKTTTCARIQRCLDRHPHRRGSHLLGELVRRYGALPYSRTRSNPEALALEVLHDAGVEAPRVNTRIAGGEADLAWPDRRLIIEIDGPQYHQFPDEDARKERRWRKAGFDVRRIPSDLVYRDPSALVALAS
jgi:very-short-patch-repair endonuclease